MTPIQTTYSSSPPLEESWIVCNSDSPPPSDIAPESAVSCYDLEPLNERIASSSSNSVKKMIYKKKEIVYYKECNRDYPPILAEIESAVSASCRLSRGDKAAEIRTVVDEKGSVIGSISFEILGFRPINQFTFALEEFVFYNFAASLVCRYVRKDDDVHPENIGLAKGAFVDVDFDSFYYPITSEIKGTRIINNGFFAPLPAFAFPYTLNDLNEFANIKDQKPCHWPTKSPSNLNIFKEWKQKNLIQKLANNETFESQKWMAFLIEAMHIPSMHDKAISPHFSKVAKSQLMHGRLLEEMILRHDDLADILPHSLEFRKFLVKNPKCYAGITELFQQTDKFYIDHEFMVKERFLRLVRRCMVTDLTMVLFKMGGHLHKIQKVQKNLIQSYHHLLDMVQLFYEHPDTFDVAFSQLETDLVSLGNFLSPGIDQEWSQALKEFHFYIKKYHRFCENQTQSMAVSMFFRKETLETTQAIDTTHAPKTIAGGILRWMGTPGHIQRILSIIKECKEEYEPGNWDPRQWTRVRGQNLDTLISNVEKSLGDPNKVIEAILIFLQEGAWNQAWLLGRASANVLLIDKLATAVLEDFKTMLTPQLLKNHEFVQVCFLIKNGQWTLIEHVQAIAEQMKVIRYSPK